MELILLKDVERVGHKGDVIRVREGYARNFLVPRSLALPATRANQKFIEELKQRAQAKREKAKAEAEAEGQKLSKIKLKIEASAGEKDKLFGSITAEDVVEALKKQGQAFNKRQIHLEEPIRSLGIHSVTVEIYPEVKTQITVEVIRKA